ncbi:MAG: ABC transporter permease [Planctomycetes bacterium]|nr:ABC transporter permease [Planctomycetota bacterium]
MTLSYVLMQNLRRNRLRTGLTIASFALPMAVFVVAISLVALFVRTGINAQREMRVAVRSKVSLPTLLPEGHRRKIEELDPNHQRIRAVCGFRWFGGKVPGSDEGVQALGCDADTFPTVFNELGWTEDEAARFQKERRAAVVGAQLASKYHWRVGERFTLNSNIPPYMSLEFVLVKLLPQPERAAAVYFRRDYMEESLRAQGPSQAGSNVYWVKCENAAALQQIKQEIDGLFANTPDETDSVDESAFFATFQQALGDIPGLMQTMAIVVVCIMGLVAGNTMMMSFRERGRELAIFKAMGFQSGRICLIVLAESVLLALLGSLAGIVPIGLWLYFNPLSVRMGPIGRIEFSPYAVLVALVIALFVGVAAGIVPAWNALRLRTVDALRRVA